VLQMRPVAIESMAAGTSGPLAQGGEQGASRSSRSDPCIPHKAVWSAEAATTDATQISARGNVSRYVWPALCCFGFESLTWQLVYAQDSTLSSQNTVLGLEL